MDFWMCPNRSWPVGGVAINREKKAFDEDSKNIKQLPQMGSVPLFLWEIINAEGGKENFCGDCEIHNDLLITWLPETF